MANRVSNVYPTLIVQDVSKIPPEPAYHIYFLLIGDVIDYYEDFQDLKDAIKRQLDKGTDPTLTNVIRQYANVALTEFTTSLDLLAPISKRMQLPANVHFEMFRV